MLIALADEETLPRVLDSFFKHDLQGRRVRKSARDADSCYPSIIKRLAKFLKAREFSAEVHEVSWFKKEIDEKTACDPVINAYKKGGSKDINHAIIKIGKLVIDPCHLRIGATYDVPWNYPESILPKEWNAIKDRTHLVTMTREDVAQLQKFALPHNNLYGSDNDRREDYGSVSAKDAEMLLNDFSLSATGPEKFYWVRYDSDRATNVAIKDRKVKIVKGDLFGVRQVRGSDKDELMLADGTVFRLAINLSDRLVSKAKQYKGKLPKPKTAAAPAVKDPTELWGKTILKQNKVSIVNLTAKDFRAIYNRLAENKQSVKKFQKWLATAVKQQAFNQKLSDYIAGYEPAKKLSAPVKVSLTAPTSVPKAAASKPTVKSVPVVKKKLKLSEVEMPEIEVDDSDDLLQFKSEHGLASSISAAQKQTRKQFKR